ncbi:MAG: HAMP domain-containing sensor histidine kinase [Eubacteriales bacterium]
MKLLDKISNKTIKSKIIASFIFLTLILVCAQVIFNLFFAKTYFMGWNEAQLENFFCEIKDSYSDEEAVLYDLTERAGYVQGYLVQVFTEEELIYSTLTLVNNVEGSEGTEGQRGVPPDNQIPRIQLNVSDFDWEPTVLEVENPNNSSDSSLILRGKLLYENEERYIVITTSVEAIDNSIQMFTISSASIAMVVLLIGIIMIIIMARSITKPIKNMELVSRKMARLDFSDAVEEEVDTLELSSLANSINSMSKQLQTSISELKEANEKLQEDVDYQKNVDTMRRQFIANVSHEMKTPLALLQIYCENLKLNIEGIDRTEYCDIIIEETGRLDSMVKDMLNVSTIENGLIQIEKNHFNLSESVNALLVTMFPLLEEYDLKADIANEISLYGDKKHIEEAMRNFIMNATTHTNKGERIHITLEHRQNNAIFTVYNKGTQIEDNDIEHIWESFYKTDKARTRTSESNAGLGLYIVKAIVENHKGEYGVENKDTGVEFWLSLPVK